jgi:hypothetical protein
VSDPRQRRPGSPGSQGPFPPPLGPSGTPPIQHTPVRPGRGVGAPAPRVRRTLVAVLFVQVVTLLLLWALQAHFTR